jgi:hypothetical protein
VRAVWVWLRAARAHYYCSLFEQLYCAPATLPLTTESTNFSIINLTPSPTSQLLLEHNMSSRNYTQCAAVPPYHQSAGEMAPPLLMTTAPPGNSISQRMLLNCEIIKPVTFGIAFPH